MDSPVRKYLKEKDYQRHKLFRKMKRRRVAAMELIKDAPMKTLRRRLGIPKFAKGKEERKLRFADDDSGRIFDDLNNELMVRYDDDDGLGEDPANWVYVRDDGSLYWPNTSTNNGTIQQGSEPGGASQLSAWSNKYRNNPILGAPSRFIDAWRNGLHNSIGLSLLDVGMAVAPFVGSGIKLNQPKPNLSTMQLQELGEYFQRNPLLLNDIEVPAGVKNFFDKDVLPRLAKQYAKKGKQLDVTSELLFNNVPIKVADFEGNRYGGFYNNNDGSIVLNSAKALRNPRTTQQVMTHELTHYLDLIAPTTPEGQALLENLYRGKLHPAYEMRPSNLETRSMLSFDNGNVYGTNLNSIIKNMPPKELNKYYTAPWANKYNRDWAKQFSEDMKAAKQALMYSPLLAAPIVRTDSVPGFKGGKGTQVGDYIVMPSAVGASELNVTTPEVVVTGTDRRPLYLRYDAPNSSYDPGTAIEGFNLLTLGGLNNLDPTLWARRIYDFPKMAIGPMRLSTYANRWINGNEGLVSSDFQKEHPWYSTGINMLGGAVLAGGASQGPRIAHNIANRNLFFYQYLTPFAYDNPLKRGLTVAKAIVTQPKINLDPSFTPKWMGKINNGISPNTPGTYIGSVPLSIVDKALVNGVENTPEFIDYALRLSRLENRFRDAAYRKYLKLPEKEPIYLPNSDGSFRYNLPYIEKMYAEHGLKPSTEHMNLGVDWITGNGGNLENWNNVSFGRGIGRDYFKKFSVQHMEDTWDLHPFRRAEDQISDKYIKWVAKNTDKLYNKLYYKLYSMDRPWGRFGYNYLGGEKLNRLRYGENVPFMKPISKISKKLSNFEVGPIMRGKPFVMKSDIPLTTTSSLAYTDELPVAYHTTYGFDAENVLPQAYFDWKNGISKSANNAFELGVPF